MLEVLNSIRCHALVKRSYYCAAAAAPAEPRSLHWWLLFPTWLQLLLPQLATLCLLVIMQTNPKQTLVLHIVLARSSGPEGEEVTEARCDVLHNETTPFCWLAGCRDSMVGFFVGAWRAAAAAKEGRVAEARCIWAVLWSLQISDKHRQTKSSSN